MPAHLDPQLVHAAADAFPNAPLWQSLPCTQFGRPPGQPRWQWGPTAHLRGVGGVYVILLPVAHFAQPRTINLHGPNHALIPFEFTVPALPGPSG